MDILIDKIQVLWKLLSTPLFTLGGSPVSAASVFVSLVIFCIALVVSKIVERGVENALKAKPIDSGVKGSIQRFARYLVVVLGTFIALDTAGVSLNSLAAFGAVLMVGVGFGLQNIAQNFVSGIILLLERPIKKGDVVVVGGVSGRVVDIRVRSTLIETRDDITIIVPNSQFIAEQVINDSFSGERIRKNLKVGVAYGSDVEKVTEILLRIAKEQEKILDDPPPKVLFMDFGDSSLDFVLRFWTQDIWTADGIQSDLRYATDREFRKAGIQIPFPQRDLHVKSVDPEIKMPSVGS